MIKSGQSMNQTKSAVTFDPTSGQKHFCILIHPSMQVIVQYFWGTSGPSCINRMIDKTKVRPTAGRLAPWCALSKSSGIRAMYKQANIRFIRLETK